MTDPAHWVRPLFLVASVSAIVLACTPKPESLTITAPTSCREGTTIQVTAQVRDAKGRVLPLPVAWALDPPAAGKLEGTNLICLAEGALVLRATAGVSATHKISITSPIIGTWLRLDDAYAGMKLRISAADGGLAAYIVGPPTEAALSAIKKTYKAKDDIAADAILGCSAHVWAPGLKKWSEIKRLADKRWSLADLNKKVHSIETACREDESKSQYANDYEMTLVSPDKLELRNLRITAPPQSWNRIADIDEAALATQKTACEEARDAATKAFADIIPTLADAAKEIGGKFWNGNGSLNEYQASQNLVAVVKAAQASLSEGAYKARRAARAVPTNDSVPNLKTVREASEAMYNACKDVSP